MAIFDRRAQRSMDPEDWAASRRTAGLLSLRPLADRNWLKACGPVLLRSALVAAGLYLLILFLNEPVIGASLLPG